MSVVEILIADDHAFIRRGLRSLIESHSGWRVCAEAADGVEAEMLADNDASSDDAIISKNLDGIITTWNQGAELIFGYTPEEAIGKNITLIIPPDRRDEEITILERLRRGEKVDHFNTVRMRKDGTTLDVSVTISPLRDATGNV